MLYSVGAQEDMVASMRLARRSSLFQLQLLGHVARSSAVRLLSGRHGVAADASAGVATTEIEGIPWRSLVDERLRIRVRGLRPDSPVSLHLSVDNGVNLACDSFNVFRTDGEGVLDLEESRPLQLPGRST